VLQVAVGFFGAWAVVGLDGLGAGFLAVGELGAGGVGQALRQGEGAVELALRAVAGQLFAAGTGLRFGGEQQAVAGADGAVVVGAQFEAVAARGVAAEFGAYLAGGVVEQQLAVLAAVVFAALDAGQGFVGGQAAGAAELRCGVAAVVEHAADEGAVDVAFEEVDEHFLADAGEELVAPAGTGAGQGDAQPAAGGVVEACADVGVFVGALPVELDFDAANVSTTLAAK